MAGDAPGQVARIPVSQSQTVRIHRVQRSEQSGDHACIAAPLEESAAAAQTGAPSAGSEVRREHQLAGILLRRCADSTFPAQSWPRCLYLTEDALRPHPHQQDAAATP